MILWALARDLCSVVGCHCCGNAYRAVNPQGYMQPLKQPENSLLCDPSLVDEIFDQIPELLEHHEQFLEQVRHCVQTWHAQQKVGALLVQSVSTPDAVRTP